MWHDHKFGRTLGKVSHLGTVRATTACGARVHLTVLGFEYAFAFCHEASRLVVHFLLLAHKKILLATQLLGQSIQFLTHGTHVHENHFTLGNTELFACVLGTRGPVILFSRLGLVFAYNLTARFGHS